MTPRQLISRVARLRTVPSQAARAFAEYVRRDLRETYDAQTTPEGDAWAPYAAGSVARGRVPPLLVDNIGKRGRTMGQLRASLVVTPKQSAGITAKYTDDLAAVHQKAPTWMGAPRRILPRTFLPRWRETLQRMIAALGRKAASGAE